MKIAMLGIVAMAVVAGLAEDVVVRDGERECPFDKNSWEFIAYTEGKVLARFPPCRLDAAGIPPELIFDSFRPRFEDRFSDFGLCTKAWKSATSEFRIDREKSMEETRCFSKWEGKKSRYGVYSRAPRDGEIDADFLKKKDGSVRVGTLQFARLADGLYLCFYHHYISGLSKYLDTMIVFEVYEDDLLCYDKTKRETRVRYLGQLKPEISVIEKFVEDWKQKKARTTGATSPHVL